MLLCEAALLEWARLGGATIAAGVNISLVRTRPHTSRAHFSVDSTATHGANRDETAAAAAVWERGLVVSPTAFSDGIANAADRTANAPPVLLQIPRSLQLSYSAACASDFGVALSLCAKATPATNDLPPAARVSKSAVLALYLLHERSLGNASRFWPYIAALPAEYPTVGLSFGESDLALLDGTVLQPRLVTGPLAVLLPSCVFISFEVCALLCICPYGTCSRNREKLTVCVRSASPVTR